MEDFGGVMGVSDPHESPCPKSCHLGGWAEAKNCVLERCMSAEGDDVAASFGPITPDTTEDGGDAVSLDLSPPESVSNVAHGSPSGEDANGGRGSVCVGDGSPHTPEGNVFDPFATAGECDAPWAPLSKKLLDELSCCVARRLNFGCLVIDIEDDGTRATDEVIVESIYRNLLEVIVMHQADEILACLSCLGMDPDSCPTPTSFPLLNDIADTCPGAPIKRSTKLSIIDWGLRKKLEF